SGAQVVVASNEEARDPDRLVMAIRKRGITSMQATPTLWTMLLERDRHAADALRVLVGGEALPKDLARAMFESNRPLWNLYGPTEATIWATAHRVDEIDIGEPSPSTVCIGRPLVHYRAYVVNAFLEPVPVGVMGELYLAGDALARGYVKRAGQTAERFVADSYATGTGARRDRTGGLARWRRGGTLGVGGPGRQPVRGRGLSV